MNVGGPIVLIEDDSDDIDILSMVFADVLNAGNYENEIVIIDDSTKALDYLRSLKTQPFLIISDINMPRMNGFELRRKIFEDDSLRNKCIPYIFLTTSGNDRDYVNMAYRLSVQGFFKKPSSYNDFISLISRIVDYWKQSLVAEF